MTKSEKGTSPCTHSPRVCRAASATLAGHWDSGRGHTGRGQGTDRQRGALHRGRGYEPRDVRGQGGDCGFPAAVTTHVAGNLRPPLRPRACPGAPGGPSPAHGVSAESHPYRTQGRPCPHPAAPHFRGAGPRPPAPKPATGSRPLLSTSDPPTWPSRLADTRWPGAHRVARGAVPVPPVEPLSQSPCCPVTPVQGWSGAWSGAWLSWGRCRPPFRRATPQKAPGKGSLDPVVFKLRRGCRGRAGLVENWGSRPRGDSRARRAGRAVAGALREAAWEVRSEPPEP